MKKLRNFWESIVYAGMKPGAATMSSRIARLFGPLRGPVERFLAGGVAPTDPLYLSNRTFGQRLRLILVVGVPLLLLLGVTLGISSVIRVKDKEVKQLTPAELAAKLLPDFSKTQVQDHNEIEVLDAHMAEGGILLGEVKNNTDHAIENAKVVLDLTNKSGERMGAVSAVIPVVGPKARATFRIDTERPADAALVREVLLPLAAK